MASEPPAEPPKPAAELPKPANQPVVRITFPSWLTVEWGKPFAGAFLTVLIGVGLQFLVAILLVIGAAIEVGSAIPWASLAQIPPGVWLTFNLGVTSVVITLTGFIWIRVSVRLAARTIRGDITPTRNKVLEGAAKFAVVYAFLELAIAIVLRQIILPPSSEAFGFLTPRFGAIADPTGAFLYGLLIGFAAGLYFFSRVTGVRVRDIWTLRLEAQIPAVVRTTWLGLVTTLKIAVPGMMIFIYFVNTLPFLSHGEPKEAASSAVTLLALMILWAGIDTGLSGMLLAMQLFLGQRLGFSYAPLFGNPSWIYAGIAIPFIALFIGGMCVARESRSSPSQAVVRGALVGVPLSLVCLIFASLHSTGIPGGFIGRAFLVSFLWGGASALGALFEAAQHTPQQPVVPAAP
ncbi:MAG TPA: hypothetical protein VKV69_01195 [Actinomycetota bacterium]|nr:hypothetical protein [Actinomycetota bacterium]